MYDVAEVLDVSFTCHLHCLFLWYFGTNENKNSMQHIAFQRMRIYISEQRRLKTMYELPCLFNDILRGMGTFKSTCSKLSCRRRNATICSTNWKQARLWRQATIELL